MQISLHKLRQSKDGLLKLEENVSLDSLIGEVPGLVSIEPVHVEAQVTLLDPHLIEAGAKQATKATFSCSRCLSEYVTHVSSEWKDWFTDEKHRAVETEEQEIHYVSGTELDLDPYIREAVLLQLPYVPVCREDCQGLCPKCGANKNKDSCECQIVNIDPRLAALEDFFKADGKDQ